MNRRLFLRELSAGGAIAIGLTVAGCVGQGTTGTDPEDGDGELVKMTDANRFKPETVTVHVGDTVVWRNTGYAPHTVTAYEDKLPTGSTYFASGGFTSESAARNGASTGAGILDGGDEYEHTLEMSGTYAYFCIPHEQAAMTGVVVVEETSESQSGGE
ncbi:cupredoxin domain-containing protein [Haladaptatus sp. NG-SE-30]